MSWRCELFESREAVVALFGFVPVGAIWPAPAEFHDSPHFASEHYARDWRGKRPPLVVQLPCSSFALDGPYWNSGGYYGGWVVTGEAPKITLSPSINIVGHYHGWIRDGVITDDCEGRKFPDARGLDDAPRTRADE